MEDESRPWSPTNERAHRQQRIDDGSWWWPRILRPAAGFQRSRWARSRRYVSVPATARATWRRRHAAGAEAALARPAAGARRQPGRRRAWAAASARRWWAPAPVPRDGKVAASPLAQTRGVVVLDHRRRSTARSVRRGASAGVAGAGHGRTEHSPRGVGGHELGVCVSRLGADGYPSTTTRSPSTAKWAKHSPSVAARPDHAGPVVGGDLKVGPDDDDALEYGDRGNRGGGGRTSPAKFRAS